MHRFIFMGHDWKRDSKFIVSLNSLNFPSHKSLDWAVTVLSHIRGILYPGQVQMQVFPTVHEISVTWENTLKDPLPYMQTKSQRLKISILLCKGIYVQREWLLWECGVYFTMRIIKALWKFINCSLHKQALASALSCLCLHFSTIEVALIFYVLMFYCAYSIEMWF